jgi:hypothetical protein
MTATTAPAAIGLAHEQAALRILEPLLASARAWHDEASTALGAVLHDDLEERQHAETLLTLAVEAHSDALRFVVRTERRLAAMTTGGSNPTHPGGNL